MDKRALYTSQKEHHTLHRDILCFSTPFPFFYQWLRRRQHPNPLQFLNMQSISRSRTSRASSDASTTSSKSSGGKANKKRDQRVDLVEVWMTRNDTREEPKQEIKRRYAQVRTGCKANSKINLTHENEYM